MGRHARVGVVGPKGARLGSDAHGEGIGGRKAVYLERKDMAPASTRKDMDFAIGVTWLSADVWARRTRLNSHAAASYPRQAGKAVQL